MAFKKGQSGNPSGRPAGAKNKGLMTVKRIFSDNAEAVANNVVTMAEAGDVSAMKIVIDRVFPAQKDSPIELKLPKIKDSESLRKASQVIIDALSKGDITPLEADKLQSILEKHGKTIELAELQQQIEELKQQVGQ